MSTSSSSLLRAFCRFGGPTGTHRLSRCHQLQRQLTQQASPLQETNAVREIHKLMAEVRGTHPQKLKLSMPSKQSTLDVELDSHMASITDTCSWLFLPETLDALHSQLDSLHAGAG